MNNIIRKIKDLYPVSDNAFKALTDNFEQVCFPAKSRIISAGTFDRNAYFIESGITYSPEGIRGEHATSVRYSGNPSLEDIISAGTGIRITRKRCIEIIEEIESVCSTELDADKTVKIITRPIGSVLY